MNREEYFKDLYSNEQVMDLNCLFCHKVFGKKTYTLTDKLPDNIDGTFCEECYKLIWQK